MRVEEIWLSEGAEFSNLWRVGPIHLKNSAEFSMQVRRIGAIWHFKKRLWGNFADPQRQFILGHTLFSIYSTLLKTAAKSPWSAQFQHIWGIFKFKGVQNILLMLAPNHSTFVKVPSLANKQIYLSSTLLSSPRKTGKNNDCCQTNTKFVLNN